MIYDFSGQKHHDLDDPILQLTATYIDFDPNDEGDFIGFREASSSDKSSKFYPKSRDLMIDLAERQKNSRIKKCGNDKITHIDSGKRAIKSITMVIDIIVTIVSKDLQRKPD